MEGTPLTTRSATRKNGETFSFAPNTFNTGNGSLVSGVKVQVNGEVFRYAFQNEPSEGYILPPNTVLELTEKEAICINIAPEKKGKAYTVVYTVYIK